MKEANDLLKEIQSLTDTGRFAIGNDLVFVPDFALSFTPEFKSKVYSIEEITYCDKFDEPLIRYASTWAAKEAVYKAFKQLNPETSLGPRRIEISRQKTAGIPTVTIRDEVNQPQISLTISHDGDYVWAIAIIEKGATA